MPRQYGWLEEQLGDTDSQKHRACIHALFVETTRLRVDPKPSSFVPYNHSVHCCSLRQNVEEGRCEVLDLSCTHSHCFRLLICRVPPSRSGHATTVPIFCSTSTAWVVYHETGNNLSTTKRVPRMIMFLWRGGLVLEEGFQMHSLETDRSGR